MPALLRSIRERASAFVTLFHRRKPVRRVATSRLPTEFGDFDIHVYESAGAAETHVALVRGAVGDGHNVLARVHSSCVTGDIFHSARCDCGPQLHAALRRIADEGRGVLIYLNQEGRGIGLANKIRAYALQDQGADTVEANERLGFPADMRDYGAALEMLRDLGVTSVRLMSNNPKKLEGLTGEGFAVNERLPLEIMATAATQHYLKTKKDKLGHMLESV
jgi:3,4-dihydroxy 2-butanone 4-phosphate synthase/GTP cyclohydrolase II